MKEKLEQIKAEATAQIQAADIPEKLNDVRVKFLGKKGELTAVLKGMKDVAPEDRPKVGQMVNETRAAIEAMLEESKTKMEKAIREKKMKEEVIDVTLPSKKEPDGTQTSEYNRPGRGGEDLSSEWAMRLSKDRK